MAAYGFDIALIAALMLLNAVFAGSEIALISLREGQLRQLERRGGRRARTLVTLARDPNRFLATLQIGITLAGYLASATAAVTLSTPLLPALGFLGTAAEPMAIALVTVALAFVNLVIGELAPKRLAMQHPLRWALLVARPLDVLASITRPLIWLLSRATDVIVRQLGSDPTSDREQPSSDEIRDLVAAHRGLSIEQRTMITVALEISQRTLRDVVVPRRAVFALPADMPVERARAALVESGHSRAPVVQSRHLDDVVGVVHLRDLLAAHATVAKAARPAVSFPDSVRVSDALRRFKAEREQFAVVIDEHGGVAGIITIEDLLEEIVGEIYDETDRDVQAVQFLPDGSLILPGTFPVHDLPDIGIDLGDHPKGDYVTIAGLLLLVLGRIPTDPGDRIEVTDWLIDVTQIARHAIIEVRLTPRDH
ncbi:membrane protein [Mycobacterium antarcticum]|uniref:hemolysin family protein n=1 Tax=Mycolicibacterium sp. TUM20983 TaxID=3023369 RepID=UPI0023932913|nr:hemolysin family protein [Mycolicibacterium sp. TUM20983]GLP76594.1 membrane protein [Mycolicibacterium sp. TUM20983]